MVGVEHGRTKETEDTFSKEQTIARNARFRISIPKKTFSPY